MRDIEQAIERYYGMPPIIPYQNCNCDEKIRRLKVMYELGRIPLEELERRSYEAYQEEAERQQEESNRLLP